MLIYTTIAIKHLSLSYDSSQQIIDLIKSKKEYKDLYKSVKSNGILDPILVNQYPNKLQVETGGQRLLLAREFNIDTLKVFIYPKKKAKLNFEYYEIITNLKQLKSYFRNYEVATYLDIEGYIKSGHIQLETDS